MDKYAEYIYAAYGVTFLCLVVLSAVLIRAWRKSKRDD